MFALSSSFSLPVQRIEENFLTDIVSEKKEKIFSYFSKKFDEFPKKIKEIEKKLLNDGIDIGKIKKDAKTAAGKTKPNSKKISNFKESVSSFVDNFKDKKYFINSSPAAEFEEENDKELSFKQKLFASLGILAVVLFLNYFFAYIVHSVIGIPSITHKIVAIFIMPLIEEYGKKFSVRHNLTGMYFTIFTVQEFIRYSLAPITSIATMIPQVIMHAATTGIHSHFKKNDPMLGYWVSVVIHMLYNAAAIFSGGSAFLNN